MANMRHQSDNNIAVLVIKINLLIFAFIYLKFEWLMKYDAFRLL